MLKLRHPELAALARIAVLLEKQQEDQSSREKTQTPELATLTRIAELLEKQQEDQSVKDNIQIYSGLSVVVRTAIIYRRRCWHNGSTGRLHRFAVDFILWRTLHHWPRTMLLTTMRCSR